MKKNKYTCDIVQIPRQKDLIDFRCQRGDVLYCRRFLEQEGVCLGAGRENGQEDEKCYSR